jgi:flagellar protein FlbD
VIAIMRLDGTTVLVNVDQIESIEQTPDTMVSLVNGHKIIARETPGELVARIVEFKRRVGNHEPTVPMADARDVPTGGRA